MTQEPGTFPPAADLRAPETAPPGCRTTSIPPTGCPAPAETIAAGPTRVPLRDQVALGLAASERELVLAGLQVADLVPAADGRADRYEWQPGKGPDAPEADRPGGVLEAGCGHEHAGPTQPLSRAG